MKPRWSAVIHRFVLQCSLGFLLLTPRAFPQVDPNVEQGMKLYGAYHGGDIDTVSLTNGNLMIHAPIWSAPQRGSQRYELALRYDNKSFTENKTPDGCTSGGSNPCTYFVDGGGSGVSLSELGHSFAGFCQMVPSATEVDQYGVPISFNQCEVSSPDGASHTMADTGDGYYRAIDGSGYRLDPNTYLATDAAGNTSHTGVFTDSNGNQMGAADTLARPVLQSPAAGDVSKCPNLGYAFQAASGAGIYNLPGPNGTATPGATSLLLCYAKVQVHTGFFGGSTTGSFRDFVQTASMLQSVVLPDGTFWAFQYDAADPNNSASIGYGDLLKITFPTGGSISYTWTNRGACPRSPMQIGSRTLTSRTVDANDGTGPKQWLYQWGTSSVLVTDPLKNDALHTFVGLSPLVNAPSCSLYETQVDFYQGSKGSGTLLKTVKKDYAYTGNPYDNSGGGTNFTVAGVVPIRETTILPSGLTTKVETDYDTGFVYRDPFYGNPRELGQRRTETYTVTYGLPVARREYDWSASGQQPRLLRQTLTTYEWQINSAYLAANMINLPATVQVLDGSGNLCAETDYFYDESGYLTTPSPAIATQHVAPPAPVRGNLTTVRHKLSATPCAANATWTNVDSHTNWFDTGEAYQNIDPLGHATTHTYDTTYAGAYPTQTCNALNQCVSGTYDFNTGLPTSFTDANQKTSNFSYDQQWRLIQALGPTDPASGVRPETDFDYSVLNQVKRSKRQTPSGPNAWIFDYVYFDGLGRTKQTRLVDPEGDDFVDTTYDAVGRVSTVSNPHRSTSSSTDGTTQTFYDALGRVTQVTAQDGSISTTDYSNFPTVTVTDPAGKLLRSRSDALGRLVEVDEPGPGVNGPGTPGQGTITVSGSLQSSTSSGTKATGSFTVGGGEQSFTMPGACYPDPVTGLYNCDPNRTIYDAGNVQVGVNGWWASAGYDQSTTSAASLASALASGFGASGSPVTAYYPGSGSTVYLTAIQPGPNYSLAQSVAYDSADFTSPSFTVQLSGSALSGGVYPATTYDSGTLTVTVGGFQASASYNQNLNTTASAMAQALTNALNASGSPVTASNSGTTITMTAKGVGTSTNFAVTGSSTASFTASSTTLSGGTNPGGLYADYVTNYSYDTLGNLLSVNQPGDGSQTARVRTFSYDSLSHLLTANNPESGTICYGVWVSGQCVNGYDVNGNLVAKTDARGITTNYGYDALNRLTQKSFSNGDPTLFLSYDSYSGWSSGTSIGRLVRTGQGNSLGHYFAYDPLGRVTGTWQCLPSDCTAGASVSAQYNLAGGLTQLTYPNGQKVTFTPDSAGRDISAVDSVSNINFATVASYSPDGALAGFVSGNTGSFAGITNSFSYNKRLQPVSMSAASPTQTVLSLNYDFHAGAGDNGNVFAIVNNKDTSRNQIFAYDQLNRLTSAQTNGTDCTKKTLSPNQTEYWGNSYTYDAWGNLLAKTVTKCSAEYLNESADTQNRMHVTSGPDYSYDAAGNMTYDVTGGHHYAYDAQSQITQVDSGATATYTYDAEGHRLRKDSGSSPSTEYVYFGNDIVAEKNVATGAWTNYVFFDGRRVARQDANGVAYYFSDHLKTADVITDPTGKITSESDYYPWGGELSFLANDSNHYKFTGKERDSETQLDYFGARYYSNGLGRFITPDWSSTPVRVPYADLTDPQTLNQYSYVRNLPTTQLDADGHCFWDLCAVETYVVVTVAVAATAAFLATPTGQQALKAGGQLLEKAVDAGAKGMQALGEGCAGAGNCMTGITPPGGPNYGSKSGPASEQGSSEQNENSGSTSSGNNGTSSSGGMKPGSAGGPGAGKKTTPKQRENTLKQNGGKCIVPGCNEKAEHTDHAIARSKNGDTTDANLQGMCAHHNCQKGAMSSAEFEQWRKDHPDKK